MGFACRFKLESQDQWLWLSIFEFNYTSQIDGLAYKWKWFLSLWKSSVYEGSPYHYKLTLEFRLDVQNGMLKEIVLPFWVLFLCLNLEVWILIQFYSPHGANENKFEQLATRDLLICSVWCLLLINENRNRNWGSIHADAEILLFFCSTWYLAGFL